MAAPPNLCRLCITTSNDDFKSLYDEYGQANDVYEMTHEYFHPKIVDLEKATHLTVICLQCFRHMRDFHSFQISVTVAQMKLEDKKMHNSTIAEEIKTPQFEIRTQTMAIKVEEVEFIGFTPEYGNEKDCSLIMENEFITLPDVPIDRSPPTTSKNNNQISEPLSIRADVNEEEDRKDSVSLPTLELTDIDTNSTCTSDNELPLAQTSRNRSADDIGNRNLDNYKSSYFEQKTKCDTLDYLLAKWIPNIKCFKCSKSFLTWSLLKNHFKRQHPNEKFHYLCCSRKFNRCMIKDHLRLHDDPEAFKCSICGKRHFNIPKLAAHYSERHPESLMFPCDKCDKRCISQRGLASHLTKMHSSDRQDLPGLQAEHSPQPTTKDNNESKGSLSMQDLTLHKVNVEEGEKDNMMSQLMSEDNNESTERFSIEDEVFHNADEEEDRKDNISLPPLEIIDVDMGSSFTLDDKIPLAQARNPSRSSDQTIDNQKSSLETLDYLLAKWIPNIKCFKCSESFPSWPLLKSHFKDRHPNETFYFICCSRKFTRFFIKDHLRLHGDPDAFKCSMCGMHYNTGTSLRHHYTEKHPESLKIKCDECGKHCFSKIGLTTHQRKMHKSDGQDHPGPQGVSTIRSPDADVTQTTDDPKSSCDQLVNRNKTLDNLLAKWIPNIKCFKCSKSFPSWPLLKIHCQRNHPKETFYYKCCSRKFTRFFIKDHLRLHSDPDAFKCSICDMRYNTGTSLRYHYTEKHPESFKIKCDKCGKHCISEIGLTTHQRKMHKSDGQNLPGSQAVSRIRCPDADVTPDDQKSSCDQLGNTNETLDYLLAKWIPNIKCFKCSKSFSSWPLVKGHFKHQHPHEKFYYKCCSRKFNQKLIKDHLILHGDPDAFKCLICQKRYTTRSILLAHNATIHPKSFKFSCDKCGKRFRSKVGLSTHHRKTHQSNRRDHAKILLLADGRTAYNCQFCGETKYSKSDFRMHNLKIHGFTTSKVVCTICGQWCLNARTFREHMASHKKKQLYKCAFCPGTYRLLSTVNKHRKKHHPLESGKEYYTNIDESDGDRESESNEVKSILAAPTKKEGSGDDDPPITVINAADQQNRKDNIRVDRTTMSKLKMEDVNTDSETSYDGGEIEQKYSTSSVVSIKNEDGSEEECFPTTSMAATAEQQMNENKTKRSHTRPRLDILRRTKRSRQTTVKNIQSTKSDKKVY